MPETLTIAVCICKGVTLSDFIPPVEILSGMNMADSPIFAGKLGDVPYRFKMDYLAPSLGPVSGSDPNLPTVNATQTYDAAIASGIQYDIIWVPAGPIPDANGNDMAPPEEIAFLRHQAPGAKYVLSVCGGAMHLGTAGILEGKRATTNKAFFRVIQAASSKNIIWVPRARWVVDGKIWTSSGVAAGSDMAFAFLQHLAGPKITSIVRGMVEVPELGPDDDIFAQVHGLV